MTKKKQYIPKPRHNPEVQAKRIERTREELEKLKLTITLITDSNEKHYQLLGNFARHDIKNIIINLNSILELYEGQLDENIKNAIQINVDSLSSIIGNFSKLIPHAENSKFKFSDLFIALRILVASNLEKEEIDYKINYNSNDNTEVNLPFQAMLQMLNNLIVNAVKATENLKEQKRLFLDARIKDNILNLEIYDNGTKITDEIVDKIFNFNFSTTGGSGIGLNHAKYLCEKFNGTIKLERSDENKFNKCFVIQIPL
ncbi:MULTISPECIES: sensor histidine kinase [Sphingobacterium]|uniref:sensor histidine kinase n=1 Tax=Sphingobacterium TaxID=28453 RepID=UPI00257C3B62|nr:MULTISPECIES: sensor histidine kinase [Sphingobacterium]